MKLIAVLALSAGIGFACEPGAVPQQPLPLQPGAKVIPLWPAGSPTLRGCGEQEVLTPAEGDPGRIQKVVNIHNPSIELRLAPKPNGLALILAAGGGNTELNVGTEGTDIAKWL